MSSTEREVSPCLSITASNEELHKISADLPQCYEKNKAKAFRCRICSKKHPLQHCRIFKKSSVQKRRQLVQRYEYCLKCLAYSHLFYECNSAFSCGKCKRDHHSLLHEDEQRSRPAIGSLISRSSRADLVSSWQNTRVVLPTCVAGVLINGQRYQVRALLDRCEPTSLIAHELIESWKIPVVKIDAQLFCSLTLFSPSNSTIRVSLQACVERKTLPTTPADNLPPNQLNSHHNLILADPTFAIKSSVQLIIGAETYSRVIRPEIIQLPGLPKAQNSLFGWVFFGLYTALIDVFSVGYSVKAGGMFKSELKTYVHIRTT